MMYRIFAAALAAGLLAAALITVVEIFTTTPMIVAAENYEPPEMHAPEAANAGAHEHDAQAWEPEGDLQRFLFTALANAVMGIAFALLLVVGLTYSEGEPDRKQGITLAAIGFAAFTLAPAMGLPPKLPGMPVADLYDRQYWWIATALLTLLGLLSLYLSPKVVVKLLGVVLVIAPHVWGAPQPDYMDTDVPATMAANFATNSLVMGAILWAALGTFAPYFYAHFKPKDAV